MWAMMPMLRVLSSGTTRAMGVSPGRGLPAVVGKGLVRLRHPVRVLLLLDGAAAPVRRVEDLAGEPVDHRLLGTGARVLHEPAHGQGDAALRADLDRNLVRRATDTAGAHLDERLHLVERALEDAERILLGALPDEIERAIQDALGEALLPVVHHRVDELRHRPIVELRIREDVPALDFTLAWHAGLVR